MQVLTLYYFIQSSEENAEEKMIDTTQLLLSICTIITSLIAIFTLREMIKQRRASMLPNILIQSESPLFLHLNGDSSNSSIAGCPYIWSSTDEPPVLTNHFPYLDYAIELINVGNGTAIDIHYEWELDLEFYLNKIMGKEHPFEIYLDSFSSGDRLSFRTPTSFSLFLGLNNERNKITFIKSEKPVAISFLPEFMLLFSMPLYLAFNNQKECNDDVVEFIQNSTTYPHPTLIVTYNDISGNKYRKKFEFQFSFYSGSLEKSRLAMNVIEK